EAAADEPQLCRIPRKCVSFATFVRAPEAVYRTALATWRTTKLTSVIGGEIASAGDDRPSGCFRADFHCAPGAVVDGIRRRVPQYVAAPKVLYDLPELIAQTFGVRREIGLTT